MVLKNWIDSGYLPAIRIGRRVRDFDALLDANYTGGKQPPAGVWAGDVPAPVAPGENEQAETARPDAPRDAGES